MGKRKPRRPAALNRRYHRYSKPDLATFAANRRLQVINTAKNRADGPLRIDYVKALKQTDSIETFRFFALSPELRNQIYRYLLILDNSFTCYPQILRVSKQINAEATSLLYCENLVQVKIYSDCVCTHGKRSGMYSPDSARFREDSTFIHLNWPDFLQRVQHLRIDVKSMAAMPFFRRRAQSPLRLPAIGNTLASICEYLAANHSLRTLQVDFTALESPTGRSPFEEWVETALYPLHLLGRIPMVTITGVDDDIAASVAAGMGQLHVAQDNPSLGLGNVNHLLKCRIIKRMGQLDRRFWPDKRFWRALCRPFQVKVSGDSGEWEETFLHYVDHVRMVFEAVDPWGLKREMLAEVEEVLRKGVEVRYGQLLRARDEGDVHMADADPSGDGVGDLDVMVSCPGAWIGP